jgi:hypothetical protein
MVVDFSYHKDTKKFDTGKIYFSLLKILLNLSSHLDNAGNNNMIPNAPANTLLKVMPDTM